MKSYAWSLVAVIAFIGLTWLNMQVRPIEAADEEKKDETTPVTRFMRAKLASSQHVLEGLVTEDYDLMIGGAEKMKVMSLATEWQVIEGPTYAQYSAEFRRSADRLIKMAKEKNTDGAALSYVHLTLTCISCHKYVRGTKIAKHQPIPPGLERALKADLQLAQLGSTYGSE